jgi:type VI secretion system protein VasD
VNLGVFAGRNRVHRMTTKPAEDRGSTNHARSMAWRSALASLLGAALLGAGCGGAPKPPPPTIVNGAIQASPQLNPSVNQRPSPLLVRVYELKSPAAFGSADFMALYQSDQATLAADLVARDEFMLQPGENRPYKKTLGADTKFIGVIGAYRNLEKSTWRAVVAVIPNKPQTLTIRAGDLAVSAEVKP